jgi:hypothetical protein
MTELIQDTSTLAANNILNDVQLQSIPHVIRGLQGIIAGFRMNIETTDAGGRKVSMSVAQARNKLKGQKKGSRKDPPQILSLGDHTPPVSIFLSNAGNHAHRKNLSSFAMNPQGETAA